MKAEIRRVASEAASYQDEARPRAETIARARTKFLASVRSPSRTTRRSSTLRLAIAAALVVVVVASFSFWRWRRVGEVPLSFTVGGSNGVVGAWIASSPVQFSDGSRFELEGDASARVVAIDAHGARWMLERGTLHAAVTHTGASHWTIDAGPYEVRVTGTRFDVAWDPIERRFSLDLREGSVVVGGCSLAERTLHAGESVHTTCGGETAATAPSTTNAIAISAAPSTSTSTSTSASTEIGKTSAPPVAVVDPPSWRDLAHAGKYAEAYAKVLDGFDARCNEVDAGDVLLLADVARYSGDAVRAERAWLALRARFPADPRAATAAFFLGRAAFDRGAFDDARTWFTTSLREAPSGALSCEARGRLIEACRRAGDEAAAKDAAKAYLGACKNGPHTKLAESVAEE